MLNPSVQCENSLVQMFSVIYDSKVLLGNKNYFLKIIANILREVFFKPAVSFPCLILDIEINITEINVIFTCLQPWKQPALSFAVQTRYHHHVLVTSYQLTEILLQAGSQFLRALQAPESPDRKVLQCLRYAEDSGHGRKVLAEIQEFV